jgi:hypothetical protein
MGPTAGAGRRGPGRCARRCPTHRAKPAIAAAAPATTAMSNSRSTSSGRAGTTTGSTAPARCGWDLVSEGFEFADEPAFAGLWVVDATSEVVRAEVAVAVGGGFGRDWPAVRDQ